MLICPKCDSTALELHRESRRVERHDIYGMRIDVRFRDVVDRKIADQVHCKQCDSWFMAEITHMIGTNFAHVQILEDAEKERFVSPPGDTLKEIADYNEWNLVDLAAMLKLSADTTAKLLSGRHRIDSELAHILEAAIGPTASFWLSLERSFRKDMGMDTHDIEEEE